MESRGGRGALDQRGQGFSFGNTASSIITAVQQKEYSAGIWLRRREKLEHSQQKCIVIFALVCCFAVLMALIFSAVDIWGEDEDGITEENCSRNCRIVLVENIPEDISFSDNSTLHLPLLQGLTSLLDRAVRAVEVVSPLWSLNSSDYESSFQPSARQGRALLSKLQGLKSKGVNLKISSGMIDSTELKTLDKHYAEVHYVNMTALTKGSLHSSFWVVDRQHFYIGSASMDWRSLATRKELGVLVYDCSCLALDLHRVFSLYWGLQYRDFIPSFWSKRLFALYNRDEQLELKFNNTKAEAYISTSPDVLIPRDRSSDMEAISRVIGEARDFIYISITDYLPLLGRSSNRVPWCRFWIHQIIGRHYEFGEFHHLLQELYLDRSRFQRYFSLFQVQFDDLLTCIGAHISYNDTNHRRSIPAEEPLYWSRIDGVLREALILRKVRVRMLISCWEQTHPLTFNFIWSLKSLCMEQTNCSLEAKYFNPRVQRDGSLQGVNHNRFMVTERAVYIGNLDWEGNEFTFNAGAGLVIRQPEGVEDRNSTVVEQLHTAFERDWFSRYTRSLQANKIPVCNKHQMNTMVPNKGSHLENSRPLLNAQPGENNKPLPMKSREKVDVETSEKTRLDKVAHYPPHGLVPPINSYQEGVQIQMSPFENRQFNVNNKNQADFPNQSVESSGSRETFDGSL